MTSLPLFIAAVVADPTESFRPATVSTGRLINPAIWDILIVITVAVLLGSVLFLWAAYWRRARRHHRHRSQPQIITHTTRPPDGETEGLVRAKRRRKFRHRRQDYPRPARNPTLAETGGLPPVRPEEPGAPPK
jgi:hypothetical protein